ncbi:MAG: hypothetical protein A4E30_01174 [Methanomassiliicoccales archaeon PtaB.Bin215]|nr:MAG: hypothetical protein A4E30_01174 [Methanomassiliicoccales archaeon PtaB.Bin215]
MSMTLPMIMSPGAGMYLPPRGMTFTKFDLTLLMPSIAAKILPSWT